MLDAAHRIRSGEDFRRVFKAGVRVRSAHLMAHSLRDPDDAHATRVGFIVSKAVGNAVVRNRTKRRLRAIMRDRLGELSQGELFVLRALPHAAEADFSVLDSEVVELIDKARKKLDRRGRRA
ncbi:ribonuclease P protein component [Brevibacterium oceani]|uniref:ribonuclease P protein component n=1 Tax=Brevibacterium oceani TaxID=358099 RepID=UPI0015E69FE8|nr:ribonuclease P protein component [Brevibacterium oceani]